MGGQARRRLQDSVTKTLTRFEATHLPELTAKVSGLVDDLHKVAERMDRVGEEVERATRIAQGALHLAGAEVERATRGVRLAFDVVEGGVRQAARVGAGVRAGLRELFARGAPTAADRLRRRGRDRAVRSGSVRRSRRARWVAAHPTRACQPA